MVHQTTVKDIRNQFLALYEEDNILKSAKNSLSGNRTVEIIGASFIANEPSIFGSPNNEYIGRELKWYMSESRDVREIEGKTPKIWLDVADDFYKINSNYGYLIFNNDNHNQFENVAQTLINDASSRRAIMIYTRPTMHQDYNRDNMNDFICTNTVQYLIRDNTLKVIVNMRSNDAIFGYANDYAWAAFIQKNLLDRINAETNSNLVLGDIVWQVGSLHIYEKHFYYLD